jgi:hypothetical protein
MNFNTLENRAHTLEAIADQQRGGLAALELARDQVDPGLVLTEQNSDVDYLHLVDASSYLSAVDAYGSPAYTPAELASAPEVARVSADKVSGAALRPTLAPAGPRTGSTCLSAQLDRGPAVTAVPPGGLTIRAQQQGVQLALRRYATTSFPLALGSLPVDRPVLLTIPADRSSRPWTMSLTGSGEVSVCRAPGQ